MQMRATWEAGNSAIEAAGGRVTAIDGSSAEGGKREIFTRDRFVMVGNKAYLPDIDYWSASDPEYAGYKSEIDQARTNLQQRGVQTIDVKGAWFEGGNIIQHMKSGTIFMGLAPDDDPQSAQKLITAINETQTDKRTMVAVPMTEFDPNGIYHLDLALSEPLANGKMLFDENITDDHTRARIEDIVGKDNIIPMTRDEAVMGSANILQVGNTAITTNISDRLKTELNKSGITTVSSADFADTGIKSIDDAIDRDGLGIGNGGIRCMGNQIGTEPRTDMNVAPRVALQMQPAA
jgi:N-dimethylarginine dimethylaminohydrolase